MAIAGRVAIVPKGDWSADATYKRLDAVTYNNTLYFAKKEVPAGTAASNTEYWSKSIVGGVGAIATAEEAGNVKPADGLTVAEDGTLKVNIDGTTLTMDQVNNVIKLADTLKEKINGAFPAANLINNLTTTEAGFGLDARQGKALDDKITEINGSLKLSECYNATVTNATGTVVYRIKNGICYVCIIGVIPNIKGFSICIAPNLPKPAVSCMLPIINNATTTVLGNMYHDQGDIRMFFNLCEIGTVYLSYCYPILI